MHPAIVGVEYAVFCTDPCYGQVCKVSCGFTSSESLFSTTRVESLFSTISAISKADPKLCEDHCNLRTQLLVEPGMCRGHTELEVSL